MAEALFLGQQGADDLGDTIDPIWTIDFESEKELLAWDKRTSEVLHDTNTERINRAKDNVARYKGFYTTFDPVVGGKMMLRQPTRSQFPRIVVNHSQDLVEQKVAVQLKYKPNFEVSPDSQELTDKQKSIAVKKFLDSNDYWTGAPKDYHKVIRHAVLTGQGWMMPFWDSRVGSEKGKKVEVFSIQLKDGTTKEIEIPVRVGEIRVRILPDWEVFLFPATSLELIPAFCWEQIINTDELRAQYPDKREDILPSKGVSAWNWTRYEDELKRNHTVVRHYYFRSSKVLDKGLYFCVTDTCALTKPEDNPIPREYLDQDPLGNLPIARLTDVDIEGEINGYPSYSFIAAQQGIFDKWFTLCHKNIFLFCHPKIAYPQNSVDEARLANGSLLLPYRSPQPPTMFNYPALTQDLLKFGELIMTNMEKVIRISGVSRGAPPPGTRAAASLYFYDEQEQTANSVFRRKFEDFVVRFQTLKLCLMSKYYAGDKQRLVRILGRNEEWLAESLDVSSLREKYSVRIRSASNLPDSKFARIQALLDIASQFPDVVTKEHVLEMLEFGQQEKFVDYARTSVMASEAENEALMAGEEIDPPEPFEMQIAHWKTHVKLAQDVNYKKQEKKIKDRIEEHIGAHELIMISLGDRNPIYKQQLMAIPQFPLFAPLPPIIPQAPAPPGMEGMLGGEGLPPGLPPGGPSGPGGNPAKAVPPQVAQNLAKNMSGGSGPEGAPAPNPIELALTLNQQSPGKRRYLFGAPGPKGEREVQEILEEAKNQ